MFEQWAVAVCVVLFVGVVIMLLRWSPDITADTSQRDDNPFASDVFKVVPFLPGCATCGSHASWFIDSPSQLAPDKTYNSEDDAASAALFLNMVYNAGRAAGKAAQPPPEDMDGYNRWKANGNGV